MNKSALITLNGLNVKGNLILREITIYESNGSLRHLHLDPPKELEFTFAANYYYEHVLGGTPMQRPIPQAVPFGVVREVLTDLKSRGFILYTQGVFSYRFLVKHVGRRHVHQLIELCCAYPDHLPEANCGVEHTKTSVCSLAKTLYLLRKLPKGKYFL